MATRVLSVDIGYSLTKVCEMDYGVKNPKIYNTFVIKTPDELLTDGLVTVAEQFVTSFKSMLTTKNIKTRKVIFSVASSKIATREVKIPYCKESQISDLIRANLSDYFPIDASQYMIAHSILCVEGEESKVEEKETDDTNKKATVKKPVALKPTGYKVLLLAAPRQLIDSYYVLAKALGLEVAAIDYSGNSVYQAAKAGCSEGTQLIIKIDERSSFLMVMKNGVIVLNRTISYGIDDAVATLSETKELGEVGDYETTLRLARRKTCILPSLEEREVAQDDKNEEADSELIYKEKRKVTESLQSLISGIARVIDYYNSNHNDEQIEKMYVTGIGADFSGISTLLTNEIGFKIKNLVKLTGINIEKTFKEVSFGEYVTCVGAVMAPLSFVGKEETQKKKSSLGIGATQIAYGVLIVGVVAGVVLTLMSVIPYLSEKHKKENYEQIIAELQPAYDTYVTYEQLNSEVSQLRALDSLTTNRNTDMISLIETLERKMPASFRLNTLTATTDSVTLDVTVETKEETAAVLAELKKIEAFIQVDTTSITEVETEIGEKQYSFTVEMIYAPVDTTKEGES